MTDFADCLQTRSEDGSDFVRALDRAADPDRGEALLIAPPSSMVQAAADRIRGAVLSHHLKPGERLLETEVAGRLGVSRGPLREAFKALEAEGLIEVRRGRGRGTFVVSPSPDEFAQMVVLRAQLEGAAARLIAGDARPPLAPLRALQSELTHAVNRNDTDASREIVWRLHETMVRMAGNRFLLQAWLPLSHLVRLFMYAYDVYVRDLGAVARANAAFVRVLEAGDPDEAEAVLRSLLLHHGYAMIGRDVPPSLRGCVSRFVREDGTVERVCGPGEGNRT